MCAHCTAAAGTAIADGIETPQHGIFEEGVVNMPTHLFSAQDFYCLVRIYPPRAVWVVVTNETGKGFSDDQAHIQGLAGIFLRGAAGTVQGNYVVWVFKHDISGLAVRDDLLQVLQVDVLLDRNQLFSCF